MQQPYSQDIPERVTRLEAQMSEMRSDVSEIKMQLAKAATKEDVEALKTFFADRDAASNDRLWWLTRALVLLFGAAVMIAFGIEKLPQLWG